MAENQLIREVRPLALSAVFAALIAVGAFLQFTLPYTPVPITLQTLFVILAGLFLRPLWAASSVLLYLFVGIIGLPVFAGGAKGFTVIMGPRGGFLLGFIPAVVAVSLISHSGGHGRHEGNADGGQSGGTGRKLSVTLRDVIALLTGTLIIYAAGYPWIVLNLGWEWRVGLANAVIPFLPGDALKIVAAAMLASAGRTLVTGDA
jgi:biotin transport system substrate-specific component